MAKIRISGNGDTFNQNEFVVDKRERAKSCLNLLRTFQESFYNSSGIDQCCRSLILYCRSNGSYKYSVKIP